MNHRAKEVWSSHRCRLVTDDGVVKVYWIARAGTMHLALRDSEKGLLAELEKEKAAYGK